MAVAVLIGFKYQREFKELPGIIVDLYHAYTFMKRIGANIHIITDIMTDENVKLLKNVVFKGVVKADIISFISDIKENEEHVVYTNINDFIRTIGSIVYQQSQVFVYYTGHGHAGHLLLPTRRSSKDLNQSSDENMISLHTFRNILVYNMKSKWDSIIDYGLL